MTLMEKQISIKIIKDEFEKSLAKNLNLQRVSAPIIVDPNSGLQDNLTGVEKAVSFTIKHNEKELEIVQSLAKWKRLALHKYNFDMHSGIYTDMIALRKDDEIDATHSIYVDQWDWEKVISAKDRVTDYLKETVINIVKAITHTLNVLKEKTKKSFVKIEETVHFITSQQLLDLYPTLTPKEREYKIAKKYKTVFIMQVGHKLSDSTTHDTRAADYDDWHLNGDLIFYHEILDIAMELSSMGIRVDSSSLKKQLTLSNSLEKQSMPYHAAVLDGTLPLTIGGGIGQSRLCMLLLARAHVGEVQASYWPEDTLTECEKHGIELL